MTDTLKPAELDLEALKKVALAVTPGDIDSAPEKGEYGHKERDKWYACPTCDGQGEVFGATYCNFDDKPLGVQFFGIGAEFGRWEDYFRAFRPSAVLSLLTRIEALEAEVRRLEVSVLDGAISDRLDEAGSPLTWQEVALSAEAQRDRMREALELARGRITMLMPADLPGSDHPGATQYVLSKVEAALSQRSGEEEG